MDPTDGRDRRPEQQTVQRFYDAVTAKDWPALHELLADEVNWRVRRSSIPWQHSVPRQRIVEYFEHGPPQSTSAQTTLEGTVALPRVVIATGRHELVRPEGRREVVRFTHLWRVRGGRVISLTEAARTSPAPSRPELSSSELQLLSHLVAKSPARLDLEELAHGCGLAESEVREALSTLLKLEPALIDGDSIDGRLLWWATPTGRAHIRLGR